MSGSSTQATALGIGGGLALGAALRFLPPPLLEGALEWVLRPAGQVFLRLLFLLAVPIVLSALTVAVAELDPRSFKRIGKKTFGFTILASGIAVLLGLSLVASIGPGRGAHELLELAQTFVEQAHATRAPNLAGSTPTQAGPSVEIGIGEFVRMIPENPIAAMAKGDMLGVIVFSVLFGFGLGRVDTAASRTLLESLRGSFEVSMYLLQRLLLLAPFGIGALLAVMMATISLDGLRPLLSYVLVVVGGLSLHLVGTYSLMLLVFARRNPLAFFRAIRLPLQTAFATASSSASLPVVLEVAERDLRLAPDVARFVLTAGASMNQNGTALFEGVTVLFLAQVFGIELSLGQGLVVMVLCVLGGIGTAGVPGASLPVIALLGVRVGVPAEALGIVLGVDRVLDMCRTTLNVAGDLVIAACVDAGEAEKH